MSSSRISFGIFHIHCLDLKRLQWTRHFAWFLSWNHNWVIPRLTNLWSQEGSDRWDVSFVTVWSKLMHNPSKLGTSLPFVQKQLKQQKSYISFFWQNHKLAASYRIIYQYILFKQPVNRYTHDHHTTFQKRNIRHSVLCRPYCISTSLSRVKKARFVSEVGETFNKTA